MTYIIPIEQALRFVFIMGIFIFTRDAPNKTNQYNIYSLDDAKPCNGKY